MSSLQRCLTDGNVSRVALTRSLRLPDSTLKMFSKELQDFQRSMSFSNMVQYAAVFTLHFTISVFILILS